MDKTGTLTHGRARVVTIQTATGFSSDDMVRAAASLDQASKHIIAQTIVEYARAGGHLLAVPADVIETPGEGIEGRVNEQRVIVGGIRFVASRAAESGKPAMH